MSEEACGAQGGRPAAEQAEGTQEAPAAQVDLEAELRQETALKEKYLAGWQRAQADLENLKKRVAREQAEMRTVVVEAFVKSMLPALDSLERATKHARSSGADDSITQGLDLVMNKFLECLEREGITPISASGEPYDPMRHEAILRVPTAEVEEGTVLDEVQRGYASRDRVIRPALVTVACRPASESEEAPYSAGGDQEPDGRGQPGNGDAGADE